MNSLLLKECWTDKNHEATFRTSCKEQWLLGDPAMGGAGEQEAQYLPRQVRAEALERSRSGSESWLCHKLWQSTFSQGLHFFFCKMRNHNTYLTRTKVYNLCMPQAEDFTRSSLLIKWLSLVRQETVTLSGQNLPIQVL